MTANQPALSILAIFFTLALPLLAHADAKVLTAEATYTMGDGETPSFAEAMVLQKAKQVALEQAGTYVESYTRVKNLDLTTEEIQTIAGGVLNVEVLEKKRSLIGEGLQLYIKIKATVTGDKMQALAQRIKGKSEAEEYKRLQEDYTRLSMEVETWKHLVGKTPPGPEREHALDQIREREKAFASIQSRETAFYQQLFSGQEVLAEAVGQLSTKQAQKDIVEDLMKWITTKGYRITNQKTIVSTSIKEPGRATLTIPVSVSLTSESRERIVQVAQQLGGSAKTIGVSTQETICGRAADQKFSSVVLPVIVSQDPEIQELFGEFVNKQVLEISARRADGTIVFENAQELMPQRVSGQDCSVGPGRDVSPLRRYYVHSAPAKSSPPAAPIFSYAPPAIEERYPGFNDIISRGRTENRSDADILKDINSELEDIKRTAPELSSKQIDEISAGCRTLSDAYKAARDKTEHLSHGHALAIMGALMNRDALASELARQRAMDDIRRDDELRKSLQATKARELKLISKQPLKKPCGVRTASDQVPSQVFLIVQPVVSTFVLEQPLEAIASINNVQARINLRPTSK